MKKEELLATIANHLVPDLDVFDQVLNEYEFEDIEKLTDEDLKLIGKSCESFIVHNLRFSRNGLIKYRSEYGDEDSLF
jgi:hypothetical protein